MTATRPPGAAEIKACCSTAYSGKWATALLGESFHPGGLGLTRRLGSLMELGAGDLVLDVACGTGASAIALASAFGCRVVGVDLDAVNVEAAREAAAAAGLSGLVSFEYGDAEALPARNAAFDALLCECAFCLFPGKDRAAREFARVLRPGGRLGMSDLTREGDLGVDFDSVLGWIACIADAQPLDGYRAALEGAGFSVGLAEPHPEALSGLLRSVKLRLLALQVAVKLGRTSEFEPSEIRRALDLARAASDHVARRRLGYAVLVGSLAA